MADARILQFPLAGVLGADGKPLSGGRIHGYNAGTSTPRDFYLDAAKTTPINPIVLDSMGKAVAYGDGEYRLVVKTASGSTVFTADNCVYSLEPTVHAEVHEEDGKDRVVPALHHARHEVGGADEIAYTLPRHCTTHQEGGTDQITPSRHASTHGEGGSDKITLPRHHWRHEPGGPDEISGLGGALFKWLDPPVNKLYASSFMDWTVIDISAQTGSDTAIAAILLCDIWQIGYIYGTGYTLGIECRFRQKGSTVDSPYMISMELLFGKTKSGSGLTGRISGQVIVPVDASEKFEIKIIDTGSVSTVNMNVYVSVTGYIKAI